MHEGLPLVAFWMILGMLVWLWAFMSWPGGSGGLGSMFWGLSWLICGLRIFCVLGFLFCYAFRLSGVLFLGHLVYT